MKVCNIGTKPGYRPLTLLCGCGRSYNQVVPAAHPEKPAGYAPIVIIASSGGGRLAVQVVIGPLVAGVILVFRDLRRVLGLPVIDYPEATG